MALFLESPWYQEIEQSGVERGCREQIISQYSSDKTKTLVETAIYRVW